MKKILTLILLLLLPMLASAYDAKINGIYYNFSENEAEVISGNDKYSGSVVIPESVTYEGKTYIVTSIGSYAFDECSGLTSVTIPEGVTSIGYHAFYKCKGLTSVIIPNSVTFLGREAFGLCSGLKSVSIGNGVTTFEREVFHYCAGLKTVSIGNGVTSIGDNAFEGCSSLTSVTIPNSVTSIGSGAFSGCSGLTSVTIPNSVTSIGSFAFSFCRGLTSVVIPNSVTSIGGSAFSVCSSLTSVTIGSGVTSIGWYAFSSCSSLQKVIVPEIAAWCGISFGSGDANPLYYAHHLYNGEGTEITDLIIPNSVTSIGGSAFYGCSAITSVTIPESVISIGENAFDGTSWYNNQPDGLVYASNFVYKYKGTMPEGTQITIQEGTLGIADYALRNCKGLTSITIPNSMTSISNGAFSGCSGLTSVNIPNSVTSIGNNAFYGCCLTSVNITDLSTWCKIIFEDSYSNPLGGAKHLYLNGNEIAELVIPEDVISISKYAFQGCSGITSVTIHDRVMKIGENAFDGTSWYNNQPKGIVYASKFVYKYKGDMPESTKIEINDGTLGIADRAFGTKKRLISVTIPNSVKFIGNSAFHSCISLSSIAVPSSVISIGEYAFENTAWYDKQPNGIVYAGKVAYKYKGEMTEGTEIIIKDGTLGIADAAFRDCSGLTSATIGSCVVHIGDYAFQQTPSLRINVKDNSITLISLWNAGYEDNIYDVETKRKIDPLISRITASSISRRPIDVIGAKKLSETFYVNGEKSDGLTVFGLEPETEVNANYSVRLQYGNEIVTCEKAEKIKTSPLTLNTLQPKVISDGNVILAAQSNLDDGETNAGFEWRRTDWTDDFDSKSGTAIIYDGMMEGYIRSVNSNFLWKFRPYYTSNAGNTYYGEWKGLDPSDYSYFEPTVHTYATINVQGNSAEVKGYAMRGTDNVTSQGFMYWPNTSSASTSRKKVTSVPASAMVVQAKGNVMTATLEDLEYETTYCYVAFVTTSEGETFYGELQTFSTDVDPDGLETIRDAEEVIEVARYDLSGRKLDKPQKGINIIRYSDGTSRKVLIK